MGSVPGDCGSPALKVRTSADSWQAEGASLESCCSASSSRGTARTEAQRLGLLACLANSNFKRSLWGPCREPAAALLRKCERLQIAGRQKGLAWKAVSQPHLSTALLTQRHRDWGCLLVLSPQTSNVASGVQAGSLQQSCSENANVCRQLAGRRGYPGKLILSLICPRHCSHRGTETGVACLSCHLKLLTYIRSSMPGACGSPPPKMPTSADSWQAEGASLESCC